MLLLCALRRWAGRGPSAALVAALAAMAGCDASGGQLTAAGGRSAAVCQPHGGCEVSARVTPEGICEVVRLADGAACDSGEPCARNTVCQAGRCQGGTVLPDGAPCDDGNPCTTGNACAQGVCAGTVLPDGSACDDSSVCTDGTVCRAGICQGGQTLACPAKSACFVDGACDPQAGCIDVEMVGACLPGLAALPLDGCCSADYAAPVAIAGSTFHLIVDSGSTTTAIAGAQCDEGCDGLSPLYAPSASAVDLRRTTGSSYGDHSGWQGRIYRDALSLPGVTKPTPFAFAAMTMATEASATTTAFFLDDHCLGSARANTRQGILGLGGSALATHPSVDTLMDVLSGSGFQDVFSTQLCNTSGRLWFGGFDPAYLAGAPAYTFMDDSDGFYRIEVDDILIGGRSLGLSASLFGGMPVVDNGTSNMHMPTPVFDAVVAALRANPAYTGQFPDDLLSGGGACSAPRDRALSRADLDRMLPSLALVLPTADRSGTFHVTMPATASYLTYTLTPGGAYYCPTLLSNQSDGSSAAGQSNPSIIGNAAMRAHVTIFDRQNQRLGFAPQRGCPDPDL